MAGEGSSGWNGKYGVEETARRKNYGDDATPWPNKFRPAAGRRSAEKEATEQAIKEGVKPWPEMPK